MRTCVVCGDVVDESELLDDFEALYNRVDCHGVEALTEREQAVYEGLVCSKTCYQELM